MELHNNPNVYFDPVSHSYLCGDRLLIGVTSLMQKHGLSPDYSDIPEKVLKKAAAEGTRLHKTIEDYDNGESMLMTPFLEQYREICDEKGLIFVSNELLVSDEETVASMIDGVYRGKDENHFILVDYKSTQKIHWRSLSWQLTIYKVLFERQFPGAKVDGLYVLHMDKKDDKVLGLFPVTPIQESEVDELLSCERDGRTYVDAYEEPSAELVLTDEELVAYVTQQNEIARLKEQIKAIEGTLKAFDKRVLDYMTENNLESLEGGGGVFKVKKAYERTTIDTERFKKMQPGLYDQYKKTTTVAASLTFKPNK